MRARTTITTLLILILAGCGGGSKNEPDADAVTDGTPETVDDPAPPDGEDDPVDDPTPEPTTDPTIDETTDVELDETSDVETDVDTDAETDVVEDVDDEDAVGCLPPWGLINELIPNETGSEGGSEESFIEVLAGAGQSLAGATLEGVNGNGGATYFTITLTGAAGTDGYYVVSESASAIANTDQEHTSLNIQNGPDSVVLRDSCGTILDAVGYGTFTSTDVFAGEGTAVAVPAEGRCLVRCPGSPSTIDTDDNDTDFRAADPTPGADNPSCS
jgi:hypothetical protein